MALIPLTPCILPSFPILDTYEACYASMDMREISRHDLIHYRSYMEMEFHVSEGASYYLLGGNVEWPHNMLL